MAGEQRRLGAVPRPLLGDAAADLALRTRATCAVVGSLAELSDLCGRDVTGIDPHRPTIDEVTFACGTCAADVGAVDEVDELAVCRRVEPVIDAWFDSGSMPAAQVGYPHVAGSAEAFTFPADFISEAIDQTRGWFYSLLAINTLVFGESPYRHVVCLGHIVDADGRKMSKSLGNIIDPWSILDTRGADAMRWWMFSQGSPWTPTRATLCARSTQQCATCCSRCGTPSASSRLTHR